MKIYRVAFFGHRDFCAHHRCEDKLISILKYLINKYEYVDFWVGRNGEFDVFASSCIKLTKNKYGNNNSSMVLVLPYSTAEYRNNKEYFERFYDEIYICENAASSHYKSAIQVRNRYIVDSANIIICYIERECGGAYETLRYAKNRGTPIINLAEVEVNETYIV